MKCRLIAAGTRLPDWVNSGFREYQKRLAHPAGARASTRFRSPRAPRRREPAARRRNARARTCWRRLGRDDYVVALEVAGKPMSTEQLSAWLAERLRDGRPLALLIGGPDGLAPANASKRADQSWSLSPLTLPHALVQGGRRRTDLPRDEPAWPATPITARNATASPAQVFLANGCGFHLSGLGVAPTARIAAANRRAFSGTRRRPWTRSPAPGQSPLGLCRESGGGEGAARAWERSRERRRAGARGRYGGGARRQDTGEARGQEGCDRACCGSCPAALMRY